MKPKNQKHKEFLHVAIDSITYTEKDKFLIKYVGYFKGKKVLEGEYEIDDMPKMEDELHNKILKEISAIVKAYGNGVKH